MESKYLQSSLASAWLHDSVEDCNDVLEVFNPHQNPEQRRTDADYLNDLLLQAGLPGHWTCYMVDKMTHRRGGYGNYMWKKFEFAQQGEDHDLDVLTLILKMCDRKNNMLPHECLSCSQILGEYSAYEHSSAQERRMFHEKMKIGKEMSPDHAYAPLVFHQALTRHYQRSKVNGAFDNITAYLPMTEAKLIMFKEQDYSPLFSEQAFRNLLKELASYSLELLLVERVLNKSAIRLMSRNYTPLAEEDGYIPVCKEVKEEFLRTGKLPGIESIL